MICIMFIPVCFERSLRRAPEDVRFKENEKVLKLESMKPGVMKLS